MPLINSKLDECLLSLITAGDKRAIGGIYDRHSAHIYTTALQVVGNAFVAEDILQDVLMAVWRTPEHFQDNSQGLRVALMLHTLKKAKKK